MSKLGVVKGPDNVALEPKSNRVNDSVPLNSRLSQLGLNIRKNVSRRAMLVAMSIAGTTAVEGCRADLPPPTIGLYFDESPDTGKDVVGGVYDLFESDAGSDTGIEDTSDGSTDDAIDVEDAGSDTGIEDTSDGSTDDVIDAEDAVDGSIDVSEVGDAGSDTGIEDANDGSTDDVIDAEDAVDGSIDASEVGDIGSDIGIEDTTDGSTDDVIDAEDVEDGSIDASDVGTDVSEVLDAGSDTALEDTTDGSPDIQIPVTCNGLSVGTVEMIPTKGPLGEKGICVNGEKVCAQDGTWKMTKLVVDPLPSELCNGQDDTCDGMTDEGIKEEMFVSFDPLKIGIGKCQAQITGCLNGKTQITQQEIGPTLEVCVNKVDDDCDGITDGPKCSCDQDGDGIVTDKFKDANLLKAIRVALGKGLSDPITLAEAANITKLNLASKGVSDLSGIECFTNLTFLNLDNNGITDLSPIEVLVNLLELRVEHNQVQELSSIAGLTSLTTLRASFNNIADLSPLKGLINLLILRANFNQLSNLEPIAGLIQLIEISLDDNQIVDILSLEKLVNLVDVSLGSNKIKLIDGLIGNAGIGLGDNINLSGNPQISLEAIKELKAKGANVYW